LDGFRHIKIIGIGEIGVGITGFTDMDMGLITGTILTAMDQIIGTILIGIMGSLTIVIIITLAMVLIEVDLFLILMETET
jgi:hypothetical protein